MKIGVPQEIKPFEFRVGLTTAGVAELCGQGHDVYVQTGAGTGAAIPDADYQAVGATILPTAKDVFEASELIVKVKEPQAAECRLLEPRHTLFTYLHLAADRQLTDDLLASGATCIAYETITDDAGRLPLLAPMSQIAGRLSVQAGAAHLEKHNGGRGVLLGGATGVAPGKVTIVGGGVVGSNACQIALGLGARVVVLDSSLARLEELSRQFGSRLETVYASTANIERHAMDADLLIGAVLVPGRSADRIIPAALVKKMKTGAVIVDVAIDQGGSCENSRPTTHAEPTFVVDGVVHYCVANMPGAVPATSSQALTNATLPYVLELAGRGIRQALLANPHLRNGLNVYRGHISSAPVANSIGREHVDADSLLQ